jgi:mannosyl-3-phosphoglycerate phosphatase
MLEQCVIFTDLDGTLLDHHDYSWEPASEALKEAQAQKIPIIINTSKTRSEVNTLLSELPLLNEPYVVENGSAIIFPNITSELLSNIQDQPRYQLIDGQHVWVFGEKRKLLCDWLTHIKVNKGYQLESYQDWTTEKIMNKTGLNKNKAIESQKKEFSEPFQWFDTDERLADFILLAESQGFSVLKGGRFFHLQGAVTKASVFDFFKIHKNSLFPSALRLKLIALGDNHNDVNIIMVIT